MGQNMSTPLLEDGEWKVTAKQQQQKYYELLSDRDWELFDSEDFDLLRLKILFALYGLPTKNDVKIKECLDDSEFFLKETVETTSINEMGYSATQEEQIKKVEKSKLGIISSGKDERQLLEEYGYTDDHIKEAERLKSIIISIGSKDKVYIAFIFLSAKFSDNDYNLPVIRVRKTESVAWYVDTSGRTYKSWSDYLSNNKLPACAYCYPEKGSYKADEVGDVKVEYGLSPSCSLKNRIISGLDIAASVFGIGAAVVGAAALFTPLAAPIIVGTTIAGVSTGVYSGTRSASTLHNRRTHGEKIGLKDAESRSAWLGIAGTFVSVSAGAATAKLAASASAGKVVSQAGRVGVNILNFGSLAVNGLGVVNSAANLYEKAKHDELTPLDVLQFTTSLFFFSHSFMNMKTASTIIKETQQEHLANFEKSLSTKNTRKAFRSAVRDTRTDNSLEGNAEIIKKINRIESKDDFFRNLSKTQKNVRREGGDVKISENGLARVNDQVTIDPEDFNKMSSSSKKTIIESTKKLNDGEMSRRLFKREIWDVSRKENVKFSIKDTIVDNKNANGVPAGIKNFVFHLKLQEIRPKTVVENVRHIVAVLKIINKVAEYVNCKNEDELSKIVQFVNEYVCKLIKSCSTEEKYEILESLINAIGSAFLKLITEYMKAESRRESESHSPSEHDGVYRKSESHSPSEHDGVYRMSESHSPSEHDGVYRISESHSPSEHDGVYRMSESHSPSEHDGVYRISESQFPSEHDGVYRMSESHSPSEHDGVYRKSESYFPSERGGVYNLGQPNSNDEIVGNERYVEIAKHLLGNDIDVENIKLEKEGDCVIMTYDDGEKQFSVIIKTIRVGDGDVLILYQSFKAKGNNVVKTQ